MVVCYVMGGVGWRLFLDEKKTYFEVFGVYQLKKVLFVDTWSKGRFFTDPVALKMNEANYQSVYLHADKFYSIDDGDYTPGVYDVIYDMYEFDMSVHKALQHIKPDIVIFISIHGMFHRWVNYVCERTSIPTLFFMHGVRFETKKVGGLSNKSIKDLVSRGSFYTIHWLYFLRDNIKLGLTFKMPWKKFLASYAEMILRNKRFSFAPEVKWGLKYNEVCVNTNSDQGFFRNFLGDDAPRELTISGHVSSRRAAMNSLSIEAKSKQQILFISQPLVSAGYTTLDSYVSAIKLLKNFFEQHNYGELVVRFHPRDDEVFKQELAKLNIKCSIYSDFADDLARTKLVIGFNSSALLGCVDIGIPVVGLRFEDVPLLDCLKESEFYCELDLQSSESNNNLSEFIDATSKKVIDRNQLEYSENIIVKKVQEIIGE